MVANQLTGTGRLAHSEEDALAALSALSNKPTAPKFSFGVRTQVSQQETRTPGPGSYCERSVEHLSRYNRAPKFSFRSAPRQDIRRQRVPGPGAYAQQPVIGQDGPAVSCTPRRKDRSSSIQAKLPGPGSHNLPPLLGERGPKHTIAPRRVVDKGSSLPGPGQYGQTNTVVAGSTPKWGFGSAPQRPEAAADRLDPTPGPGSYRHTSALAGPKCSMRMRTEAKMLLVK